MKIKKSVLFAAGFCCVAPAVFLGAEPVSVAVFLRNAVEVSEEIRALDVARRALEAEIRARDLPLSATLGFEARQYWDDRETFASNPQTRGKEAEVSLSKPLASGTRLNLLSGVETGRNRLSPAGERHTFGWEAGIFQSLWQDSFGRQTSMRRRRDEEEYKARLLALLLDRQRVITLIETLYWDLAYSKQEIAVRRENLQRSERIHAWIQDRYRRSAAEKTDMLQVEALLATRRLQLQLSLDQKASLMARLQQILPDMSGFSTLTGELEQDRDLSPLMAGVSFAFSEPTLLETLLAHSNAALSHAQEAFDKDRLKPALEVGYLIGQKGLDSSFSKSVGDGFSRHHDYHELGVRLSAPLGLSLIQSARRAAELASQARALQAARYERQSQVQWGDLRRALEDQQEKIKIAAAVAAIQKNKADEERARYQLGRTTAFQAITFEKEAAESELLVWQLRAQLRRLEGQARFFAVLGPTEAP